MKLKIYFLTMGIGTTLLFALAFFSTGCQYDYNSPSPGIIEIRLKTISNNLEFDPKNSFVVKIASVQAVRSNLSKVVIYEDIKAIEARTNVVNTLDYRARDSSLIIGETYVPPGDYVGVNMLIEPGENVILRGYQIIEVDKAENLNPLLTFRKSFQVKESQTTVITLTIDLDKSLIEGAFTYTFEPSYAITSIQ